MRLKPQRPRGTSRIEAELLPPCGFIAVTMQLAMMSTAQRDGELVTDPAAQSSVLRKTQMMGVARLTSADLGNKLHMLAVANAPRLGMAQDNLSTEGDEGGGFPFLLRPSVELAF